jgi:hypothetical protein
MGPFLWPYGRGGGARPETSVPIDGVSFTRAPRLVRMASPFRPVCIFLPKEGSSVRWSLLVPFR